MKTHFRRSLVFLGVFFLNTLFATSAIGKNCYDKTACPDIKQGENFIEKCWCDETTGSSNIDGLDFTDNLLPEKNVWTKLEVSYKGHNLKGNISIKTGGKSTKPIKEISIVDEDRADYTPPDVTSFTSQNVYVEGSGGGVWHLPPTEIKVLARAYYEPVEHSSGKVILFAHGMNDNLHSFDTYTREAENRGYRVFRTDVPGCGTIEERATELARYINENAGNIGDKSLIVVAHSMGGLDVRYIVGESRNTGNKNQAIFKLAAEKIKTLYTIATPHGGVSVAVLDVIGYCQPAVSNLTNGFMGEFNKKYPYSEFTYPGSGQKIGFMALHFQCQFTTPLTPNCVPGANDCLAGTNGQTWKGAPCEEGASRIGCHAANYPLCPAGDVVAAELFQANVINDILDGRLKQSRCQ